MCDLPYCYPIAVLAWYPSVDGPCGCARRADPATLATELLVETMSVQCPCYLGTTCGVNVT